MFGPRLDVLTSLAGRLPTRPVLPGRLRVGGFGGADGLAAFLGAERIDLLVDATHPFAETISHHAADASAVAGVPRLMLVRPAWQAAPGDRWLPVENLAQAAALLPGLARRVWLTIGAGGLEAFSAVPDTWFLVRLFAAPAEPLPLPRCQTIIARPPFTPSGERALIDRHGIEALVAKNAGGPTEAKLAAARELGLPVVIVRRPPQPAGEVVGGVDDALAWLRRRL
jgi:precorrin-6A/cobalt-precorrin-6A reductase